MRKEIKDDLKFLGLILGTVLTFFLLATGLSFLLKGNTELVGIILFFLLIGILIFLGSKVWKEQNKGG